MTPITLDKTGSPSVDRSNCRFVERDEFVRLLLSTENLIRADEGIRGLKGLFDVQSNLTFLIDEVELFGGESGSSRFQR